MVQIHQKHLQEEARRLQNEHSQRKKSEDIDKINILRNIRMMQLQDRIYKQSKK